LLTYQSVNGDKFRLLGGGKIWCDTSM